MILGRRDPPSLPRRLRGWLWPRTGLRRAGRYLLARARRMPGTPHAVAAGFAAGAAVSVTPFLGGHLLLTVALAWLTGGNVLAALLGGVVVGNPWTVPLFLAADYRLGCLVLGLPPEGLHHLARLGSGGLLAEVGLLLWPMTVGAAPLAVAAWAATYLPLARAVAAAQARRRRRREEGRRRAATRPGIPGQGGRGDASPRP